jgi:hypothetical protein
MILWSIIHGQKKIVLDVFHIYSIYFIFCHILYEKRTCIIFN